MSYVNEEGRRVYLDCNDVELKDGDVIDIKQTVNGRNIFFVKSVDPLEIYYGYDISQRYEYGEEGLLDSKAPFDDTVEWEIIWSTK